MSTENTKTHSKVKTAPSGLNAEPFAIRAFQSKKMKEGRSLDFMRPKGAASDGANGKGKGNLTKGDLSNGQAASNGQASGDDSILAEDIDRKQFLTLMGAATVMTTAACEVPKEAIAPLAERPPELTPGVANWYASICGGCSAGCGTLVKTREGRPIKLEGNSANIISQGGLCAHGQGATYDLYDPTRLRKPMQGDKVSGWGAAIQKIRKRISESKNKFLITSPEASPSKRRAIASFAKANNFTVVEFDLAGESSIASNAQKIAYGQAANPRYRLERARVIVSVGSDLLGEHAENVGHAKGFTSRRNVEDTKQFNKLIVFEPMMTVTGMNADLRSPIKSGAELSVLLTLANELAKKGLKAPIGADSLKGYTAEKLEKQLGVPKAKIQQAAADLAKAGKRALVAGGAAFHEDNTAVQVAAAMINTMLGSDGTTVDYNGGTSGNADAAKGVKSFINTLNAGAVDLVIVHKANPVYEVPSLKKKLAQVKTVVHIGDRVNETGKLAEFNLPLSHFLEEWNDVQYSKNAYGLGQPTIRPLWQSKPLIDILAKLNGGKLDGRGNAYQYIRQNWNQTIVQGGNFKAQWDSLLQSGFYSAKKDLGEPAAARAFKGAGFLEKKIKQDKVQKGMTLTAYRTPLIGTGEHANNPLHQEVPDPVTKVSWGNVLVISRALAKKMDIATGDVVKVGLKGAKKGKSHFTMAAYIQPGLHAESAAVAVGYGRTEAGPIGNNIGTDVLKFGKVKPFGLQLSGSSITIEKTGEKSAPAMAQQQWIDMDDIDQTIGEMAIDRNLIPTATVAEYNMPLKKREKVQNEKAKKRNGKKDPRHGLIVYEPHLLGEGYASSKPDGDWKYDGPIKWGMVVDMAKCTGCAACVTSCYVENNIPAVGPQEVSLGREMSWMRIDRYYSGTDEDLQVVNQPLMCQQCDNAPCENVCPVAATVHSDEGINVMAYNRCVGTRYCANNCPYKVRRFNWREYWYDKITNPVQNLLNPDVSVRMRGIMEKCNFCLQRLHEAKGLAKDQGLQKNGKLHVPDGMAQTACQQSCPADALHFGNLNDPDSSVAQMVKKEYHDPLNHDKKGDPNRRGYRLLDDIRTQPGVTYLARITNA